MMARAGRPPDLLEFLMTSPERKIITPTVGRKVWFRPNGCLNLQVPNHSHYATTPPAIISQEQPLDATVVYVWNDRTVNLVVFDHYGFPFVASSVTLVQEGDAIPGIGFYCEWMPYQTGQARKEQAPAREDNQTAYPSSRHQQMEWALVSGAARQIAADPERARDIANGIKTFLQIVSNNGPVIAVQAGPDLSQRDVVATRLQGTLEEPLPFTPMHADGSPADPEKFGVVLDARIGWAMGEAPRVTEQDVRDQIVGETYTVLPSGRVTVCELTLRNGFTVRGESAVVFIENNVPELGRKYAREDAERKVWMLCGFLLRENTPLR